VDIGVLIVCAVAATLAVVLAGSQHIPPPAIVPCDVGATPEYFVPGDGPSALVGCVRLPVSGLRVDFSAGVGRIDGAATLCIDPAYGNGEFIPSLCKLEPPVSAFAVRAADQPRQGVDGYGYVVWGTVGGAGSATARFDGGVADTARLACPPSSHAATARRGSRCSSPSCRCPPRAGP
jgi:hypothetical protein